MDSLATDTINAVADTAESAVAGAQNSIPDFGIFGQLANYGALGLVVLALGAVCWMFIKRQLDEKDRLQKKIDEMYKDK